MTDVVVVVPAFDEEACVGEVVTAVRTCGYECVVVDDASTDRTADVAERAGAIVIRLPINLGVGGALRAGFRFAIDTGAHTVVQVDGDGQHPTEQISALLRHLDDGGFDMVVGSRFAPGGVPPPQSTLRRAAIGVLSTTLRRRSGLKISDPTSGFRAIRDPLLHAFASNFPHHYLGDTFEALLVAGRRGYRVAEIPVLMQSRQGGQPSAGLPASVRATLRALTIPFTGCSFDLPPRTPS
ncbi:MAG: glycosyltransferase family 2 protein [Actinomycetota bacterium]|nr:glycosyltransferase family 2 protein [Actinomycetota bacterium]